MMEDKDKDKTDDHGYWRSLNELAGKPEFRENLGREFPDAVFDGISGLSRRSFLGLMGASLALAGLAGCRKPVEKIIPYVNPPEEIIPGVANYYATTMPMGTAAYGVIVECHEGRPTKIEGNPRHPASKGAANAWILASILGLYDPDRSQKIMENGIEKSRDDFVAYWRILHEKFMRNGGKGLAILAQPFSSPTQFRLMESFRRNFPESYVVGWQPVCDLESPNWLENAVRKHLQVRYRIGQAKVILSLDSDFLLTEPDSLAMASDFAESRRLNSVTDEMNRLYVVESGYTVTGAMADHRLRLRSLEIGKFLAAVSVSLKTMGLKLDLPEDFIRAYANHSFDTKLVKALADDLYKNRGRSLILYGRTQSATIERLAYVLNQALGNIGHTIEFRAGTDTLRPHGQGLKQLTFKMQGQLKEPQIDTLVILNANPVYAAPHGVDFADLLKRVPNTIHVGEYCDETARHCRWHVPLAHYLEGWGDARAIDGTSSLIQPMIAPLYDSSSLVEIWNLLATGRDSRGYDLVRETWRGLLGADFEKEWQKTLHDGLLENSALPLIEPGLSPETAISALRNQPAFPENDYSPPALEITLQVSPAVYDGRFANNGWLQELPDPITKLTWDNAALINIRTAREFGLENGDVIKISLIDTKNNNPELRIPVWIQPGTADYSITIPLGYGRESAGKIGSGVGLNAYRLMKDFSTYARAGFTLEKTGQVHEFANTQEHGAMEGRAIFRETDLEKYRQDPKFAEKMVAHPPLKSIFKEHNYDSGYQWGMAIDLNACIGCGACTIACQSENNIPIVGKEQVINGREMHWIRNDRYYVGASDDPRAVIMPMACQHCENAPCESVCPVSATTHDKEGLNVMTYNRCIGTRYCSNNCPYKVRRFNFFNYTKDMPETVKMAQNPDVTVRFRGVMEKCTFCTQRINRGKQAAKKENRTVRDGEIQTACQQACPTKAITFGNILDPESKVAQMKNSDRNYALLAELNIKPRNTYLARIRNPHPDLENSTDPEKHG